MDNYINFSALIDQGLIPEIAVEYEGQQYNVPSYAYKLFYNSEVCRKLARKAGQKYIVSCILPPPEWLIINFEQLLQLLEFADAMLFDLDMIIDIPELNIYYIIMREKYKTLWESNSLIMQKFEHGKFERPRLAPPNTAVAGYPMTAPRKSTIARGTVKSSLAVNSSKDDGRIDTIIKCLKMMDKMQLGSRVQEILLLLLTDINDCGLIKNEYIFKLTQRYTQTAAAYKYMLRIFFVEEISKYTAAAHDERYILPLNIAEHIIEQTPRASKYNQHPLNVLKICTNLKKSLLAPFYIPGNRGLYTLEQFQQRLNVFTFGLLKYLKWNKIALCGSVIAACACKTPLEAHFRSLSEYFEEYYTARSRDPAAQIHVLNTSRRKSKSLIEDDEVIVSNNSIATTVEYTDIDIMVEAVDEEFDAIAKEIFEAVVAAADETNTLSKPALNYVVTENKYKYTITGLKREFDIFSVNSIPGVIVKFHVGEVRAWYDGNNVYCFPSFISAAATGISPDVRWISCNKDPRAILYKYMQRGFGCFLGLDDRKYMEDYLIGAGGLFNVRPTYFVNKNPLLLAELKKVVNPRGRDIVKITPPRWVKSGKVETNLPTADAAIFH